MSDRKEFTQTDINIDQTIVTDEIEGGVKDSKILSSTTDQKIVRTGKVWQNGKPVFRETIYLGTLPNAGISTHNLSTNSTDIDEFVSVDVTYTNGTIVRSNAYTQTSSLFVFFWVETGTPNVVKAQAGADYSSYTGHATVEFTKN